MNQEQIWLAAAVVGAAGGAVLGRGRQEFLLPLVGGAIVGFGKVYGRGITDTAFGVGFGLASGSAFVSVARRLLPRPAPEVIDTTAS